MFCTVKRCSRRQRCERLPEAGPLGSSFYYICWYHRLARADTPASVSFRRFLPFSPWRAPARLRLKSQKSLVNSSLAGALQFCRSRNVPRQGKARREYCRILKGLDAVWGHFCPSKPCLPLLIDGTKTITLPASIMQRRGKCGLPEDVDAEAQCCGLSQNELIHQVLERYLRGDRT